MPIEGLPSSSQQEAFGASGAIIGTGFEKKLNQDKIAAEIAAGTTPFKNILVDMVNSKDNVTEVEQKEVGIELEAESTYTKALAQVVAHHTASLRKKIKEKKPELPKAEEEVFVPEEELTPEEKAKRIEETFLKDYIALAARWIVGRPASDMEGIRTMIGAVKRELVGMGITADEFKYIDQKTLDMIKEAFLQLIKDKFLSSLEHPLELVELILRSTKSQTIVDFLTSFERDAVDMGRYVTEFDIKDLASLAVSIGINIEYWMKELKLEKIKLENFEHIDKLSISFRFEETREVEGVSDLITSYRNVQINIYLSDSFFERIKITIDAAKIALVLKNNGLTPDEINELKTQSRRIAWLKTISMLKREHLNRILTGSSKEFNEKTKTIARLTRKSQKLGYDIPREGITRVVSQFTDRSQQISHDIPKEGMTWLNRSLSTLAVETGEYKLELLKSLQKISFEEERNKDIQRLTKTLERLKKYK